MVSVTASVNLPLHHKVQKFSSATGPVPEKMTYNVFSGTLNPTHFTSATGSPGCSRKKGRKMVVCVSSFLSPNQWCQSTDNTINGKTAKLRWRQWQNGNCTKSHEHYI